MMMMMMKMMMDGAGDDRWPVITNTRTRVGIAFLLVGPGWVVRLWKLVLFFFFVAHSKLPKNRIHPTGLGDFFIVFFFLIKANFKLFSLLVPSIGKQSKKICFTTFLWILPGFPGFSWILLGYIGFNFVLLSFYRVLLGFIGFYQLLPGFPGFSWILLGYIEFCFVLLNFYRVLLGFIGFYQFLPGFISIYRVLLGFTEFRFIDYFHCQWFGKARTSRVLFLFPFFFCDFDRSGNEPVFSYRVKKNNNLGNRKRNWFRIDWRANGSYLFCASGRRLFFDYLAAPVRTKLEARGGVLRSSPLRRHGNRVAGAKPTKKKESRRKKRRKKTVLLIAFFRITRITQRKKKPAVVWNDTAAEPGSKNPVKPGWRTKKKTNPKAIRDVALVVAAIDWLARIFGGRPIGGLGKRGARKIAEHQQNVHFFRVS